MKTKVNRLPNSASEESPANAGVEELRERLSQLEAENAILQQSDECLHRNVRLFEALLLRSRDGVFLVTPHMTFLRMIHSILGHNDQDTAGRSVLGFIHPGDHARLSEAFARLMSDPSQSVLCECRARDKDGGWWWVELEMTDLLDDPAVQAIVFNTRNITQRKKYEEALQRLESPCPQCGWHVDS